jgi:hypothetical protein
MKKIFKILVFSFVFFTLLLIGTDIKRNQGIGKNKSREIQKFGIIDPIGEKMHNRKFMRKPLSRGSTKNIYSRSSSSHCLIEVGAWGYGSCDHVSIYGNRAYMGSGRCLIVLDISDKTNPVKLGEIMFHDLVHWISVSGSYVYVANWNSGLRIVDISDIQHIQEVGYFETTDIAYGVFVSGTYAYVAAGSSGLRIIDISTPSSPQEVGFYDTFEFLYGVFVSGGYAYVSDRYSGLTIIDVTNPGSPQEVGFLKAQGGSRGIYVSGNYAYLAGGDNECLRIIDVSNPGSPQEAGSYYFPSRAEEVYVLGNYAYVTNDENGLRIIDISNPNSPNEVGFYDTPGVCLGVYLSGNYAYVADDGGGLRVVYIMTPSSPNEVGSYNMPGKFAYNIYISGNYAYIALGEYGLMILDITNPGSLKEVGTYKIPWTQYGDYVNGVTVSGNYAYVAYAYKGLRVIDVSNPASPNEVGFYDTPGSAIDVYISGNYAYVADSDSGLRIINVSNPYSPQEVGFCDTPGSARDVYVSGNYAYVADWDSGLRVINISNPGSPHEVGFFDTPGTARGVQVSGGYTYVADGDFGLRVIALPEEKGYYDTPGYLAGVFISGNYAYGNDSWDLRVLDISNPGSIEELCSIELVSRSYNVFYSDGYIYIPHYYLGGMTIFKHETTPPAIAVNREQLNFGYEIGGNLPGSQIFSISNSGGGTLNWTVNDNAEWLNCSPTSGTNSGVVTVSIDPTGLSSGTYTGSLSVEDTNASNSPQTVNVSLEVYSSGSTSAPFGSFETPVHGSTIQSSVPVTGWVLDDIGVVSVKIYRAEGKNLVYIGDGLFVEGARPDIEQAFPDYPNNYKAGWGYMMLTNFVPNGGNGTFTFHAIATDIEGHPVTLGIKTVTIDNANAVKPFGAIDTPTQGGIASGSHFRNQGWVLTPMPNSIPTDGSTINVIVDGVNLGHPTYNIYRSDIATLFPGYANSDGALAYFDFDTTTYTNGVHTIAWTATDDAGNADGIGSRYFSIQNSIGAWSMAYYAKYKGDPAWPSNPGGITYISNIPIDDSSPVEIIKGYKKDMEIQQIYPDDNGIITVEIQELEPLEVRLFPVGAGGLAPLLGCTGCQVVGPQLRPLPIGSTLDTDRGVFYWQPGPGFVGQYRWVFIKNTINNKRNRRDIIVKILPKWSNKDI